MSNILDEGFLATDIEFWVRENEQVKGAELGLARDVNRLGQKVFLYSIPKGDRGLMIAALLARMLEHYQGTIILEERNLSYSSTSLARVLLETAFSLVACVNHEDFCYKLADWDSQAQQRLAASLLAVSDEASLLTEAERAEIAEVERLAKLQVKELNKQNKAAGLESGLPIERIAEYAGMSDFFHAIYSVFSSTVHSGVRCLGGHVELDESGRLKSIAWGPDEAQGTDVLRTAVAVMLHALEAYLALHPSAEYFAEMQPLQGALRVLEEARMKEVC
ncbi:MAG: DUF5677 domain-containing protein [Rickettsiales bacterium]|nr:DUF5677 domain-containing protein [Rickettsiales bacterium]